MGIFDDVFGKKIEGDGNGLFSSKYKAEHDVLHDPLPATAYADTLKKEREIMEKEARIEELEERILQKGMRQRMNL